MKNELNANSEKSKVSCETQCNMCGESMQNNDALRKHKRSYHGKTETYNHCGKVFHVRADFEKHMDDHNGEKPFKCETCGRGFYLEWRLKKHTEIPATYKMIRKCHYFNNGRVCPFEAVGCKFSVDPPGGSTLGEAVFVRLSVCTFVCLH